MKTEFLIMALILLQSCSNITKNANVRTENSGGWQLLGFVKADSINPILEPSADKMFLCPLNKLEIKWEERNVLNPSAVVKDDKVYMIYRAQDNQMTSRLGLAVSVDGFHFTKEPLPVFYPGNDKMQQYEWKGGVEDPRIVESEDGTYILT